MSVLKTLSNIALFLWLIVITLTLWYGIVPVGVDLWLFVLGCIFAGVSFSLNLK